MIARTVLVGFDGSEHAQRAALRAAELAGDGRVVAVIVIEPSEAIGARIEDLDSGQRERHHELVGEARALLGRTGVAMDTEERVGDPAEEIVRASEKCAADLIVIGRHGSGFRVLLRRTVWDRVAREAKTPVLVVP